jgi:hypothetical protein
MSYLKSKDVRFPAKARRPELQSLDQQLRYLPVFMETGPKAALIRRIEGINVGEEGLPSERAVDLARQTSASREQVPDANSDLR